MSTSPLEQIILDYELLPNAGIVQRGLTSGNRYSCVITECDNFSEQIIEIVDGWYILKVYYMMIC